MVRRRGGKSEGGGHDGAGMMRWLLTYADLITLLMVFFIVLYSISEINQSKYIALSNAIRASFSLQANSGNAAIATSPAPSLDAKNLPQTGSENGLLAAVGQQIMDKVKADGVQKVVTVRVTPQGLRISFHAQAIFFAKDSTTITPTFEHLLLSIAPILRPLPNQIQIQGYTDNEPNPETTSWELSASRAVNVLQFLVDHAGIARTKVSAVAFGQYHPLYSNATPQGQAMNRSVDLLITKEPAKLPKPLPVPGSSPPAKSGGGAAAGTSVPGGASAPVTPSR